MTIDGISKMTYTYNTERGKVHSNLLTGNRVGLDGDMHIPSAGTLMVQPSPKEDRCSEDKRPVQLHSNVSIEHIDANPSPEIG